MEIELSEYQRRVLMELVICHTPIMRSDVAPAQRNELLEAGYIKLEAHPTRKRAQQVIATEKGWAWVVDHLDVPFTTEKVTNLWNRLAAQLQIYLRDRSDNLSSVLSAGTTRSEKTNGFLPDQLSTAYAVEKAYLHITDGLLKRRVKLKALRVAAELSVPDFSSTVLDLVAAGRVALYPEDDRSLLDAADHESAVLLSGIPQHIIYWEH